jgi:hypothetical protein
MPPSARDAGLEGVYNRRAGYLGNTLWALDINEILVLMGNMKAVVGWLHATDNVALCASGAHQVRSSYTLRDWYTHLSPPVVIHTPRGV